MRALLLSAVMCGALASTACKGDPHRPPISQEGTTEPGGNGAGGGTSSDGGRQTDGGDAGSACTDLANTGAEVLENSVADPLPNGTGGTIVDGTYDLVEARLYETTGVPGLTQTSYKGSIRITGTTFERVLLVTNSAGTESEQDVSGSFTQSGSTLTVVLSCPIGAQEPITFTALDNSLRLSNLTTKESFLFTKQP